ncbi:DNA polymerase III [Kineococcus sp. R8]|nr:DNA polymerase III [Kineococcus siccus]
MPTGVSSRYPQCYAVLDVETTGLLPEVDRVVQIAVTLVDAAGVAERSWSTLVDPQRDPGPVHVHGITRERLRGAPTFDQVAGTVAQLLAGRVFVAHNAQFDWGFLGAEMRRAGEALPVDSRLCTRDLAKRLDLPVANLKLSTLAAHWNIPQHRAHDAEDDTRVLVEVLRRQLSVAAELGLELPLTPCRTSARPLRLPRPVPTTSRPVRPPRVACSWELPPAWRPGTPLVQGHRVVVSGPTTAPRADLYRRAIAAGLDVKGGVSRATAAVVANDSAPGTRKLRDAESCGTPRITEADFEALLLDVTPGTAKADVLSPEPRASRPRTAIGPFARRRVLVLGGPHELAARVRAEVVARGGSAAVRLTTSTTEFVALDGARQDQRWARVHELDLPRLDPTTWQRLTAGAPRADSAAADPVVLPRGGTTDLPGEVDRWLLDVTWTHSGDEVDVVALRVDDEQRVTSDDDVIFYGAPTSPDGSVSVVTDTPGQAEVAVDLSRLPDDTDEVLIVAALAAGVTFGSVGAVDLTLRTADGAVSARATLDAATVERTLVLGELYRRRGSWRFRARGQGYEFGLSEFLTQHGVEVEA